mgnify:CR=1 FL=1
MKTAPAPLGLEDYAATATGVTQGAWALFRLWWGPKWEPASDEISAWSQAVKRVWHHYQLPLVGPVIELLIVGFQSAAKRADSGKVRGWFAGAWRWARGGSFHDQEETAKPQPEHG